MDEERKSGECNADPAQKSATQEQESEVAGATNIQERSNAAAQQTRDEYDWQVLKWTRRTAQAAISYTLLTFVLLALSGYSAYEGRLAVKEAARAANAASQQTSIARTALIGAQRPWIYASSIAIGGPLFYNVNGANITLTFTIENIGHSPANAVQVFAGAGARFGQFDVIGAQNNLCSRKILPRNYFGQTLFPGQITVQKVTVAVPQSDLDVLKQKSPSLLPALIYGCIQYGFADGGTSHRTDFALMLLRSDLRVIDPREGDRPADALAIRYYTVGNSYAD